MFRLRGLHRPDRTVDPEGNRTWIEHDGLGRITRKLVETTAQVNRETIYGYDLVTASQREGLALGRERLRSQLNRPGRSYVIESAQED